MGDMNKAFEKETFTLVGLNTVKRQANLKLIKSLAHLKLECV